MSRPWVEARREVSTRERPGVMVRTLCSPQSRRHCSYPDNGHNLLRLPDTLTPLTQLLQLKYLHRQDTHKKIYRRCLSHVVMWTYRAALLGGGTTKYVCLQCLLTLPAVLQNPQVFGQSLLIVPGQFGRYSSLQPNSSLTAGHHTGYRSRQPNNLI